jgi:hypothetical protein
MVDLSSGRLLARERSTTDAALLKTDANFGFAAKRSHFL